MGIVKAISFLVRAFFVCCRSLNSENLTLQQQLDIYKHSVTDWRKCRPVDGALFVVGDSVTREIAGPAQLAAFGLFRPDKSPTQPEAAHLRNDTTAYIITRFEFLRGTG
jgi:hypothetical protein